jgi:hypothetical protein
MAFRLLPSYEDQFLVKSLAEKRAAWYTQPDELPQPLLKADYNKSVRDLYRDLAMDHIDHTKSLEILSAVQSQEIHPLSSDLAGCRVGTSVQGLQFWVFTEANASPLRIKRLS